MTYPSQNFVRNIKLNQFGLVRNNPCSFKKGPLGSICMATASQPDATPNWCSPKPYNKIT